MLLPFQHAFFFLAIKLISILNKSNLLIKFFFDSIIFLDI